MFSKDFLKSSEFEQNPEKCGDFNAGRLKSFRGMEAIINFMANLEISNWIFNGQTLIRPMEIN